MRRDLVRAAAAFNGRARARTPRLWLFTDPDRLPDPFGAAARLPRGSAVVYRHFGAKDRAATAARLAVLCRRRGLDLFVGADPRLARRVGAHVHMPERSARHARSVKLGRGRLVSLAWHKADRRPPPGAADMIVLSPLAPTRSASARPVLGLRKAARFAGGVRAPVIGLGGLATQDARTLARLGFSGLAGVDLFR